LCLGILKKYKGLRAEGKVQKDEIRRLESTVQSQQDQIKSQQDQIKGLERIIQSQQDEIQSLRVRISMLEDKIESLSQEFRNQKDDFEQKLREKDGIIESQRQKIEILQKDLAETNNRVLKTGNAREDQSPISQSQPSNNQGIASVRRGSSIAKYTGQSKSKSQLLGKMVKIVKRHNMTESNAEDPTQFREKLRKALQKRENRKITRLVTRLKEVASKNGWRRKNAV
jgi:archaellum component FlaC